MFSHVVIENVLFRLVRDVTDATSVSSVSCGVRECVLAYGNRTCFHIANSGEFCSWALELHDMVMNV